MLNKSLKATTAAALALGLAAAPASADSAKILSSRGEASGAAVNATVQLPAAAADPILGSTVKLVLGETSAILEADGSGAVQADMIGGALKFGGGTTTVGDAGSATVPAQTFGPLHVGAADASWSLKKDHAHAATRVAGATVTADVGAAATVTDAVDEITNSVNELIDELNAVIDGVGDQVGDLLDETGAPVDQLPEIPTEVVEELPELKALAANVPVLQIGLVESSSDVLRDANGVVATQSVAIGNVSVLGGRIEVPAFRRTVKTSTTTAGVVTEANSVDLAVRVADATLVRLEDNVLYVGNEAIDLSAVTGENEQIDALVNELENAIDTLFSSAGLSTIAGKPETSKSDEDGVKAGYAAGNPFVVKLAPQADNAAAVAVTVKVAEASTAATTSTTTTVTDPKPKPKPEEPKLPRTGGGAAALALGSLFGAGALRRR